MSMKFPSNEPIDPVKLAEETLKSKGELPLYQEQRDMITPMFEALQKKGIVFVGQGPTGMGKTFVIGAVAKALTAQGKRVCIAVPSYSHLKEVMGFHLSKLDVPYSVLRGLSALEKEKGEGCPLKGGERPSAIFCSDSKNSTTGPHSDRCNSINCTVKTELAAMERSSVVLTVYHKLIAKPSLLDRFDVTIFDESHGLEPALRNARIVKIRKADLETLSTFSPQHSGTFARVISSMDSWKTRPKDEVPGMYVERAILDPLKEALGDVKENIRKVEESKQTYDENIVGAYYSLEWAITSLERGEPHRFVYHNEAILGIPHRIAFSPFATKKEAQKRSIALISATIENPRFHANDAGFLYSTLAPPVQIQSARLIQSRFRRRPIIGLVDGPILRIDLQFPESYQAARAEANKTIASIVPFFKYPVLILCRNNEDAESVESHLCKLREVQSRLFLFEEEGATLELDAVETRINGEIEKGRNIIVTTASSRVWEGANLKQLRMLIVDALPYPSPQPFEKFEHGFYGSWRTSRTFRFMIRRLQQGIGRLIRTDKDPWGIVVVIDGRFNAQWKTIRSALPSYMTDPNILKFVIKSDLKTELDKALTRLEKMTYGPSLDTYLIR